MELKSEQVKHFHGCLLTPLRSKTQVLFRHPDDSHQDDYMKLLKEELIPRCAEMIPEGTLYAKRIVEALTYNVPSFDLCWNSSIDILYRMLTPQDEQTEEGLKLAFVLRACMDINFAMSAVLDDISDGGETRCNKPAWYRICPGGKAAAMYDGVCFGHAAYFLLEQYFKGQPSYERMLKRLIQGNAVMIAGQAVDCIYQKSESQGPEIAANIRLLKAGHFVATGPVLALLHAGITDETLIGQCRDIFVQFGTLIQTWDDFTEFCSTADITGKAGVDSANAAVTWVSTTATKHFNNEQKQLFKANYGSADPDKKEAVLRLFQEIDLPQLYAKFMSESYVRIAEMINELPHAPLQLACYSWLNWLIGEVKQ